MKNLSNNCFRFCFLIFFIVFNAFLTPIKAQYASFGSGLGLNILRSDDIVTPLINAKTSIKNYALVGKPSLSLNIDYNFPREITQPFLKRIYNPLFSNQHTQLRGQIIFNQFNISSDKNNSVATLGASFLYFPVKIDENKQTNFFLEAGYKLGWNNTIVDPFNCLVAGIGTRHRLGNDWYWQTNLSFTWSFYDYLDQTGPKGYAKTSKDGFFLLNFSLLKPFLTNKEQKRIEQSRDSLSVAENFATSISLKSVKIFDLIKSVQIQLKSIEDRVLENENSMNRTSEMTNSMLVKVNQSYGYLKTKEERLKVERDMDSLRTIVINTGLALALNFEKIQFEFLTKNPLQPKMNDVEDEIKDVRKNLLLANKFLPRSKDFKSRVVQLEVRELGKAKASVDKMQRELMALQSKIDKNKARLKALAVTFDKTTKALKNTGLELEKIIQVIDKVRSN
jgi:hypothetical protein